MTTGETAKRRMLVAGAGAAAIVVGGVLIGVGEWQAAHVSFGWFAYAPLSHTAFSPTPPFDWAQIGVALLILGAAVVAFAAGRKAAAGGLGAAGSAPILRPVLGIAGVSAVVAGVALEVWASTRLVIGWHDLGPRSVFGDVVATRRQFESRAGASWHGPAVVGVALLIVGVGALAFVVGRDAIRRRLP